ncbi:phage tail tape measure protein [Paenarthrobacter ilicis]|uniref:phage tail tape measure protein n=1 Tax=Paenarthrobacter ilicis TaxID=43665 RepID=UPI0028D74AB4|nr:phage tail tape measure protein [Paenarthrobacter ilicis]
MASERSVVVRVKAEISDFKKQMQEATKASEQLGKTVQEAGNRSSKPLDETATKAGEVRAELIKAGAAAQTTAKGLGLSYDSAGQLRDEFGRLVTGAKAASLGLETTSEATREFAAEQQHAADKARMANSTLGELVQSAVKNERAWSTSGAALLGFGTAVSIGVGLAIKSYMEFDRAMSEVQAATHASAGDMEQLRAAAIKAGADTSFSAKEAAEAISELSKAGVSTKDILAGGLTGAMTLAAAGSLEVADAAELAATAMVQFKLKGDQIPHLADLLAAGAGKAQGSVEDLGMALKQGGLIAASTGLSIEETAGGLAAFASAGLIGSDAGTSFKTMLMSLTPNSKEAAKEMERLGINAYDQQGKFIGLSKFAGVLQNSMRGLTDEQRNASMKIIFGSDAVRAANVLYEQGAKGIADWTAQVNDSGYAAATAAIKQDNLAGDIEKVGGSLDSVFLKSGSGANDVLRSLAQSANTLLDSIGEIPGPLLQTSLGLAAVTGGGALVAGMFLTTFPRIIETKKAFDELSASSPKAASGLSKVGKAAATAGAALVVLQAAGALSKTWQGETKSVEDYAQAFLTLGKSSADIDAVVRSTGGLGTQINGVGDALVRVNEFDWYDNLNNWAGDMVGGASNTQKFRDSVKGLDNTLVSLVQNGGAKKAGESFKILNDEANKSAEAQGKSKLSTDQMLKLMPQYTEELKRQGTALGLKLSTEELHDLALGKIPPRMEAIQKTTEGAAAAEKFQAQASEEAAKKLEEMGLKADGTIGSLSKLLDVMFQTGLATLSARDAESAYQEALDGLKVKIDGVTASQSAGNMVLDQATGSFDLTTEAGRGANAVFGELAQKAIATTTAMANNGATQAELQSKLGSTYQSLYDTARAFGASEAKADDLARSALNIPKSVPIETAIQNFADSMAKLQGVKSAADALDGKVSTVRIQTIQETYNRVMEGGPDPTRPGSIAPVRNTGGIVGFRRGGIVPGTPPLNPRVDNIAAMTQNGTPYGIRSGEWIINEPQSKRNDRWLRAINNGLNLDDVLGYQAPSKSMASGYGTAMGYSGSQERAAASTAVNVDLPAVYVQNPFTGQYLLAKVSTVASGVLTAADNESQYRRNGRQ